MRERQQCLNSAFEGHQMVWQALKYFEQTPKGQAPMWERFEGMPASQKRVLAAFYGTQDDCTLFAWICKFWAVSISARAG